MMYASLNTLNGRQFLSSRYAVMITFDWKVFYTMATEFSVNTIPLNHGIIVIGNIMCISYNRYNLELAVIGAVFTVKSYYCLPSGNDVLVNNENVIKVETISQ